MTAAQEVNYCNANPARKAPDLFVRFSGAQGAAALLLFGMKVV